MKALQLGHVLGSQIARALGLDPDLVGAIAFVIEPTEVVKVRVCLYITDEQGTAINLILQRHRLISEEDFERVKTFLEHS